MNRRFIAFFILFSCSLFAAQSSFKNVSQAYWDGEYDFFLKDLQAQYEKGVEKNKICGLTLEKWEMLMEGVGNNSNKLHSGLKDAMRALAEKESSHSLSKLITDAFPIFSKEEESQVQLIESISFNKKESTPLEEKINRLKKDKFLKSIVLSTVIYATERDASDEETKSKVFQKVWVLELDSLNKMKQIANEMDDQELAHLIEAIINKNEAFFELQWIVRKPETKDQMESEIKRIYTDYEKKCVEGLM